VGHQRFMNYVSMQDCPEPAIVARALMRNDPANGNRQILAVMSTIHKWR